ncbi:hypothetical protein [Rhodanobacter spathiphylli]|uniref:hypothetical protein n=1 Tax=Rhodanobacter spathiphylli TaxID=347483 RepID=UPI0012F93F24|nr:hypothetical protein [Rhodanobacter spathiphylli]
MQSSISFDSNDGSIRIATVACPIAQGMRQEVAASELAAFFRNQTDHGNGYVWLAFHQLTFNGQPCGVSLCFHLGKLESAHFGVALPDSPREGGWPTRQAIDAEISFMRQALSHSFSRSFSTGQEQFTWGAVWSLFDAKGFQASSGIRYAV